MRALLLAAAFSLAACTALEDACVTDGGVNAATCPQTWVDSRMLCMANASCTPGVASCLYPGAGNEAGGCVGTAVLSCTAVDAGAGLWSCAM